MNLFSKIRKLFCELTLFERTLWICSVFIVILSYVLSTDKDFLNILASLIGVTALIFVAKGYVIGQVLTVVFALFYGVISLGFRYYGEMITYLGMSAPMAIAATVSWIRNPYKDTNVVKVGRLTAVKWTWLIISSIAVTAVFYFILDLLGTENLIFSTISVTTSWLASVLTFFRSPYYALAYAANDVVLIILWVLATLTDASYFPMIMCFVMFFANDMYGFFNWKRIQKGQA